jgi:SpoVK/Ycf46/Vps4 family AAA+-type ATPase
MKANNGLFVIDDFGRQQIDPKALLNRWIVPLDRRVDFMTLHTGMKFEIPFDQLVVFSTNLEPKDLVDEAFLRRIRYKIKIEYPSEEEFEAIFKKICQAKEVVFDQKAFDYLKENYYKRLGIRPSANHPRDLIEHIIDRSRYYRQSPALTEEGIAAAWENYFVEL